MKVKSESEVSQSCPNRTAAYQAPPSMGFSRQKYWSGVPLPSLGHRIRDLKFVDPCFTYVIPSNYQKNPVLFGY